MDWTEIILAILSGTTLGGIVEAVRYRKENKRIKEAETSSVETSEQHQRIDLAEAYMKKVLELSEQTYQTALKGNGNQAEMMESLNQLKEQVAGLSEQNEKQDVVLNNIVTFLDGEFEDFLKQMQQQKGKPGRKPRKKEAANEVDA